MDRSKKSELMLPRLSIISAVFAAALVPVGSIAASMPMSGSAADPVSIATPLLTQDDDSIPDEDAVPSGQVEKYIAVYSAMQKNHSLTVEQAASKQGLTVEEFRTLEDKIERNPTVHERVLDALKASTTGTKAPQAGAAKPQ